MTALGKIAIASRKANAEPERGLRESLGYFDPRSEFEASERNLPHWYQSGASYFVTFRLADSIPQSQLAAWKEERADWLARHPEPRSDERLLEYAERFPDRIQKWLDAGMGSCLLGDPTYGNVVADTLLDFADDRYLLGEWVVMPNHIHVIFQPIPPFEPKQILHSWKSYTASRINKTAGRSGSLWQRESYDRLIRTPSELLFCSRYILENPAKAGLDVVVVGADR